MLFFFWALRACVCGGLKVGCCWLKFRQTETSKTKRLRLTCHKRRTGFSNVEPSTAGVVGSHAQRFLKSPFTLTRSLTYFGGLCAPAPRVKQRSESTFWSKLAIPNVTRNTGKPKRKRRVLNVWWMRERLKVICTIILMRIHAHIFTNILGSSSLMQHTHTWCQ